MILEEQGLSIPGTGPGTGPRHDRSWAGAVLPPDLTADPRRANLLGLLVLGAGIITLVMDALLPETPPTTVRRSDRFGVPEICQKLSHTTPHCVGS